MNRSTAISVIAALFLVSGCTLFQSSQSRTEEEVIIGKIGDEPVTLQELKSQFNRSNALLDVDDDKELENFLPLYMDYRLKLAVAKDAGYMEDPEIREELSTYERQSAYPYWLERHIRDKLMDELYERSSEHIHAQHILIEAGENATPSDTARAYNRLMEAREKFLSGEEDFISLSNEYSSQRRGQSMGGDIGYFGAGWSVKPFEDTAYSLNVGEVSKPFRTQFGYHIIYVKDRIETGPNKRFSHIFYMTRGTQEPGDSIMARAETAWNELQDGEPWIDVVEAHSEDEQSRLSGGNIGWISYGMYEQAFTETLMQLDTPGEYTRPFESQYGIHIARLDSIYHPTEEEIREELAEKLQQLPRFRDNERAVLDNAASLGNARFHRENLASFEDYLRDNFRGDISSVTLPDDLKNETIFSFNNKTWTVAHYFQWLKPVIAERTNPQYHHRFTSEFKDDIVDSQLISLTREQFPEFGDLSHDYLTGLAVFRVNEDSIWTYARHDTLRLKEIYESNPDDYHFDTRYRYVRFSARADTTLDRVRNVISGGEPVDSIRNEFTNVIMRRDVINQTESTPYKHLQGLDEGEFSPYFEYNRRQTTMFLEEILEARPMTFEEAYNKLVTDYQSVREQEWLQAMREKYRVEVYPEVLQSTLTQKND